MTPQIELVRLLREAGLKHLKAPERDAYFVPLESDTGKLLVNIELQENLVHFSCVVVPIERIPVGDERSLNQALLQAEARLCRYSRDRMGNIVVEVKAPPSLINREFILAVIGDVRESTSLSVKLTSSFATEGTVVLFPARLQPPHKGHIDGIVRLLEGDESLLAHPRNMEDVQLLKNLRTLVIAIGQVSREKGNPLHLGERRDLIIWEIDKNARLRKHADRIELEPSPIGDPNVWLAALLRNLPVKPDAIATANSQTLVAARDMSLRAIEMVRDPKTLQSGTNVRRLIAEDKLEEVRTLLSAPVFERCQTRGYFKTIKDIETAY